MHYRYAKQNIPIELLRTLVALADLKNFTKVAQSLELTQPAISAQIKRLQTLLGNDLFDKSAPGVVLTEEGETIVRYARRILETNDQILQLARSGRSGSIIRLGAAPSFVKDMLRHDNAPLPQWTERVQISSADSDSLLRTLQQGYLDLALVLSEAVGTACCSWPERIVWASAPDLVLAPSEPIPIISNPNTFSERVARAALDRSRLSFRIIFVASNTPAYLAAVEAGLGVAALPQRLLTPELTVTHSTILPPLPPVFGTIHVRNGADETALVSLIDELRAALGVNQPEYGVCALRSRTPRNSAPAAFHAERSARGAQNIY